VIGRCGVVDGRGLAFSLLFALESAAGAVRIWGSAVGPKILPSCCCTGAAAGFPTMAPSCVMDAQACSYSAASSAGVGRIFEGSAVSSGR
jgi:hypothetical protein